MDILGWSRNDFDFNVELTICGFAIIIVSAFSIPITVEKLIDEINIDEYDALAISGGFEEFGFYEDAYNVKCLKLIREFDRQEKLIVSICVGALPIGAKRSRCVAERSDAVRF